MFREILLGIVSGIISALVPGMHINSLSPLIASLNSPTTLFAAYISFTFFLIFPPVFLYSTNSDIGALLPPSQRMALKGEGKRAVSLCATGTFASFLIVSPFMILARPLFDLFNNKIIAVGFIFLIMAMLFYTEHKKLGGVFIFFLCGALGMLSMKESNALMPLLTGLFGVPFLLSRGQNFDVPSADGVESGEIGKKGLFSVLIISTLVGSLAGLLPGITPGAISVLLYLLIKSDEHKIFSMGAIAGSNVVACIGNFYATGKTRSGVLVEISKMENIPSLSYVLMITIIVAVLCFLMLPLFSKMLGRVYGCIGKAKLIFVFVIAVLSFMFAGLNGVILLSIATTLGLLTKELGVRRIECMGVIILPTLCAFILF
jgi:Predicted membrane protein